MHGYVNNKLKFDIDVVKSRSIIIISVKNKMLVKSLSDANVKLHVIVCFEFHVVFGAAVMNTFIGSIV